MLSYVHAPCCYRFVHLVQRRRMDVYRLSRYAAQVAALQARFRIVIVSSGSVAVGRGIAQRTELKQAAPDMQTLAMLGSAEAAVAWQRALRTHGLLASQLLVTHRTRRVMESPPVTTPTDSTAALLI